MLENKTNGSMKSYWNSPKSLFLISALAVMVIAGIYVYLNYFSKKQDIKTNSKVTPASTSTTQSKTSISGVVQKLETSNGGKNGVLFVKSSQGLPQDNKPMLVYQVELDDSVIVNLITPAKNASATKPESTPTKWTDIKKDKFVNVYLDKDPGSNTTIQLSGIKKIEIIGN